MPHGLTGPLRSRNTVLTVFDVVLDRSLELAHAAFGNIQVMNWQTGCLEIATQRGFQHEFLKFFQRVRADDQSACAQALRARDQVIIEDVATDKEFSPLSREIVLNAGVRAVQSTPMISSRGAFIGMLSTHYTHAHVPSLHEMATINALAQVAANAIITKRARENESRAIEKTLQAIQSSRDLLARVDGVVCPTKDGGLLSCGPDPHDLTRRAASYVDRILKGEKPADMPVQAQN